MLHPTRREFLAAGAATGIAAGLVGAGNAQARLAPLVQGTPAADRLGWRVGFSTYTFRAMTLFETLEKVASVGLHHVELFAWQKLAPRHPDARPDPSLSSMLRKELKTRASDLNVKMTACYTGLQTLAGAKPFFEFAAEMGFDALVSEPPEELLDRLDELAQEFRVDLALHNHPKPSHYWNPETARKALIGRSPRMGLCCDTGHWCRSGLEPVEMLQKVAPRVKAFHLKDLDAFGVPGAKDVVWGQGKGRIPEILAEVKRQGLKPYFGIEWERSPDSPAATHAASVSQFEKIAAELIGH